MRPRRREREPVYPSWVLGAPSTRAPRRAPNYPRKNIENRETEVSVADTNAGPENERILLHYRPSPPERSSQRTHSSRRSPQMSPLTTREWRIRDAAHIEAGESLALDSFFSRGQRISFTSEGEKGGQAGPCAVAPSGGGKVTP